MASITTLVFAACSEKKLSLIEGEITVQGDTIYYSGNPYAKLWTIDTDLYMTEKGRLFSKQATRGLGLVIHYYSNSKDIWIYPKKGVHRMEG